VPHVGTRSNSTHRKIYTGFVIAAAAIPTPFPEAEAEEEVLPGGVGIAGGTPMRSGELADTTLGGLMAITSALLDVVTVMNCESTSNGAMRPRFSLLAEDPCELTEEALYGLLLLVSIVKNSIEITLSGSVE
jgi:hypothetical protein